MRVVLYTRVSTVKQAKDGMSLVVQEAKARAFAIAHDLEIVMHSQDAGVSAKDLKREGLSEALEALKSGVAEGLLVVKMDRLTRSVADMAKLVDEYFSQRSPYELYSVFDSINTSTAMGRLMLNVMSSFSQFERELTGERVRATIEHKTERGEFTGGGKPFGYRVAKRDGVKVLEPDPDEQVSLKQILKLHRSGLSPLKIAGFLNENRTRTKYKPRGKEWYGATVRRILKREEQL